MLTGATVARATGRSAEDFYRLGEFTSYHDAARMMLRLFEAGFPILQARIVDLGPYGAERSERLAEGRAALFGAALGAWLAALTGVVLALVVSGVSWLDVLSGSVLIGAVAGGVVGLIIHWATDARRDNTETLRRRYAVEVDSAHILDAVRAFDASTRGLMVAGDGAMTPDLMMQIAADLRFPVRSAGAPWTAALNGAGLAAMSAACHPATRWQGGTAPPAPTSR